MRVDAQASVLPPSDEAADELAACSDCGKTLTVAKSLRFGK